MKQLFQKYKPVLRFILLFLGSYLLLSMIYGMYLHWSKGNNTHSDYVTSLVARQSQTLLTELGYDATMTPTVNHSSMDISLFGVTIGRIVEGCNGVSVIILFISFVVAFAQRWKKTILFLLGGAVLIYAINLVRIVILSIALYRWPEHQDVLHRVVFPAIIYGMVFILWIFWVRSLKMEESNA